MQELVFAPDRIPAEMPDGKSLRIADALTVEAWVAVESPRAEALQAIASKWEPVSTFDAFDISIGFFFTDLFKEFALSPLNNSIHRNKRLNLY